MELRCVMNWDDRDCGKTSENKSLYARVNGAAHKSPLRIQMVVAAQHNTQIYD
jgi:hypothetical protein